MTEHVNAPAAYDEYSRYGERSRMLSRLRRRDGLFWAKVLLTLVVGVPLCLAGPLLLATLFWAAYQGFTNWRGEVAWVWFFLALCGVILPLLFRLELKAAGDFLARSLPKDSPDTGSVVVLTFGQVGALASVLYNARESVPGITEMMLTGPRLVVNATRQVRLRRFGKQANLDRAVETLQTLLAARGGVPTTQLLRPGETPEAVSPTLAYLLFHDWIGVSRDGAKVWLHSDARRKLGGQ